jgi:hypothetical protein
MKKSFTALTAMIFAGAIGTAAMAQYAPYNGDLSQGEITNFNHYLDNHPELAQRLAANPALVNDPQFIANHPGFQTFMANHPGVREEIHESPGQFMYREGHYEWAHGGGPVAAGPGTTAGPVARFDNGYLDEHPEVAHQLGANPGLADNPAFLTNHPGLDGYLANHPEIRTELQQHPYKFMSDEWRDDLYGKGGNGITHGEVARFDKGYLDQHPEVAQQLGHDPRLVDNPQFLATHPGLDDYFKDHPETRQELQQHPDRFMVREDHYDGNGDRVGGHPLATTDHYLDAHPEVAQQVNRDPALVDNSRYVDNHRGLHEYLNTHPNARQDWESHPDKYMAAERHYEKKH